VTLSSAKGRIRDFAAKRRPGGTPNPNLRKKVKTCVTKLYITNSDLSISDFTIHECDECTGKDDCEDDVDCLTQPLEPNDFVLLKLATKKTVKYFVGLIQEMKSDGYNATFVNKRPTCWIFRLPKIEDTAGMDLIDIILKLPHPVFSGSSCRIVIMIFGMNLSGFMLTKADVCEVERKSFCHLR